MAGIDRLTGKPLAGFDHVVQSLRVIFATRIGARVMRRTFGSQVPALLGRNIAQSTFLRFATAVHMAVELWEPRFRLQQVTFPRDDNTPETVRKGRIGLALVGEYRPRALQGDPTPEATPTPYVLI